MTHEFPSRIIIIGAGDAAHGVMQFLDKNEELNSKYIKIIDANRFYNYQSSQTLIGAGLYPIPTFPELDHRPEMGAFNRVYLNVKRVNPEQKYVECEDGSIHPYQILIIATGTNVNFNKIKGLKEAIENPDVPVGSNYTMQSAVKFSKLVSKFKGGNAVFTQPSSPIKCGGAPQKILYLCSDIWSDKSKFPKPFTPLFFLGGKALFANSYYAEGLKKIAEEYHVKINLQHELVEVNGKEKIAYFKTPDAAELVVQKFDIMHVTPIHEAPAFIKESGLANVDGYVHVNINTLQHVKYPEIFAIGDSASLPTSKTLSSVSEMAPILAKNIDSFWNKKELEAKYNGYTACPIFLGKNRLMLCEFGYDEKLYPTFFNEQREPSKFLYYVKFYAMPVAYKFGGPKLMGFLRRSIRFLRRKN